MATRSSAAKKHRLVVFDGNSIVHRAYHALPPTLTTRDGRPVNAVYGFVSILLKALADIKPQYVVVAWDYPAETFRHALYVEYKATRQKADPELYAQIPIVKQVVEAMNIPLLEVKGYEADDILGTLAHQAHEFKDVETVLVTGDKDALQLVDSTTWVYAMKTGISEVIEYDPAKVHEKFGLSPAQLIEFKALRGDPSDNIPGVTGVGEKTATKLIQNFGSIAVLYTELGSATKSGKKELLKGDPKTTGIKISGKLFERLVQHQKDAELSRTLVTIDTKAPVKLNLQLAELANYDHDKVVTLFAELQFKTLVKRLPTAAPRETQSLLSVAPTGVAPGDKQAKGQRPSDQEIQEKLERSGYVLVNNETKLKAMIAKLSKVKRFAFDTETTILGPMGCELVGLSFCAADGEAFYVPVGHEPHLGKTCTRTRALELLKVLLENPKIGKVGHNAKYDLVVLKNYGITVAPVVFDTMIASYLLDPGRRQNSLDALAFNELGYEMMPIEECIGVGRKQCSFSEVDLPRATFYAAEDADYTWRLLAPLEKKIKASPGAQKVFQEIEVPLIPVLVDMEFRGVKVDTKVLVELAKRYSKRVVEIRKQIYKHAKGEFNISSPNQLQEVLFERLAIPTLEIKRTKTGYSTAASELEKLRGKHPIVDLISEYRELTKLISTYLEALPELVEPGTGRVHTSYNQTIAATGRLSSTDPNLQNIPVRTEVGNEIRKAFVPEKGNTLVALDYSQIELRIAAHFSQDPALIKAFTSGQDIHAATASRVLKKPMDKITKAERSAAKMMNFGVIYGLSAFGLSQRSGMSRDEAHDFIENYFASYPKLKEYIDGMTEQVRKTGYVETLFGRRRYLPEVRSQNWQVRAGAERAATNHPFQGTNADIIKKAMITIHAKVPGADKLLLMQVHDELIFEIPTKDVKKVADACKKIMETVTKLRVPIVVDISTGSNWGELEKLKKD
ncbi:MAG: DNA polymerase I [Candidatus Andersenbacteria bacterium]